MLETEEVDDDFFTPVASTSLANIFGNVSKSKESAENDSLKYIPPKPQNIVKSNDQVKATECIFACALVGHEWCNNVYTSKGKLGFAIIKVQKTGVHSIVLYDANKTTLSTTVITTKLEVIKKNNIYISYYDSLQKYWSLYGTGDEITKIIDLLNKLGANTSSTNLDTDKGPPESSKPELENITKSDEIQEQVGESDTDSSTNKKTRASILNRMANMGHSVLPIKLLPIERSSDSSDTDKTGNQPKAVRHKTGKNTLKKTTIETVGCNPQDATETHQRIVATKTEPDKNITLYNSHIIPLTNSSIVAGANNDLGMFMSEQRISNSEIRININRLTDKLDLVLDRINNFDHKDRNTNVSSDIMMKLLTEYENKIKVYEELLKTKSVDNIIKHDNGQSFSSNNNEIDALKSKISMIEKENTDKSNEIHNLQRELKHLNEQRLEDNKINGNRENDLLSKINKLEDDLRIKNTELTNLTNKISKESSNNNIGEKVKNIMNDTFQTISMNFENQETYTGETIKRIIGTVLKKITIQSLSEL